MYDWVVNAKYFDPVTRFCLVGDCKKDGSKPKDVFRETTAISNYASHLVQVHGIQPPALKTPTFSKQPSVAEMPLPISTAAMVDSAIAEYLVLDGRGHASVERQGFLRLLSKIIPKYKPKSSKTMKRRVLSMYCVLKSSLQHVLSSAQSKFSLTFDGWSNPALRGFYGVTLHWCKVSADGALKGHEIILDFFHADPGAGVGNAVGGIIFQSLKDFGISDKIIATVSDGGSDALAVRGLVMLFDSKSCIFHISSALFSRLERKYLLFCWRSTVETFFLNDTSSDAPLIPSNWVSKGLYFTSKRKL